MKTIKDIEKEFDKKLLESNWTNNMSSPCKGIIKSFYRDKIKEMLKGLKVDKLLGEEFEQPLDEISLAMKFQAIVGNKIIGNSNSKIDKLIKDL